MSKNEYTILTAFVVNADSMKQAQELLMAELPRPAGLPHRHLHANEWLDCWWIAEDERYDGSDNDSATFIPGYHQGNRETSWERVKYYLRTYLQESADFFEIDFDEDDEPYGDYFDEFRSELSEILRDAVKCRKEEQ